ncbi:hypothetical protein [Nonomuraea typhae]|uniref:Uncharacterized protein n=1 Tax=Nonomuraea typhae TaxID=2603600 RepID=A0ABW7YX13_9ACTN
MRATVLEAAASAMAAPEAAARLLGAAARLRGVPASGDVAARFHVELAAGAAMPNPERYAISPLSSP